MLLRYLTTYVSVNVLCILLSLIIFIKFNEDVGSDREIHMFRRVICAYLAYLASDTLWVFTDSGLLGWSQWANGVNSVVNMGIVAFINFFWFCYAETKLRQPRLDLWWFRLLALLPLSTTVALYIVSLWNGAIFRITDFGLEHGPFYFLPIIVNSIYLLFPACHAIYCARRRRSAVKRREYYTIVTFIAFPFFAGVADYLVPSTPVLSPGIFSALFFTFMTLQNLQVYHDALTGLNNRRRADQHLNAALESAGAEDSVCVFMLDVNLFKQINDRLGHLGGDRALRLIADVLRSSCAESGGFLARWGGDEFLIIVPRRQLTSPEEFAGVIQDRLANAEGGAEFASPDGRPLSVSIGWAASTPGVDARSLLSEADSMLYRNKQKFRRS